MIKECNDSVRDKQVAKKEFEITCEKYKMFNPVIEKESDMKSSYLMIDSSGDFYIDRSDAPIGNLLEESFISLMSRTKFDDASFVKRYIQLQSLDNEMGFD